MLVTTEMRWFAQGSLPEPLLTWFQQDSLGSSLDEAEPRKDYYLYIPGCEFLNVKFRQGKLEVKWRQTELNLRVSLSEGLQGPTERWIKWSCEEPQANPVLPETVITSSGWIEVQKTRLQRFYTAQSNPPASSETEQSVPPNGCSVELTQLRVHNQPWWSLAFEAIGEPSQQIQTLQNTATQILSQSSTELTSYWQQLQLSCAYPRWLFEVIGLS